MSRLDEIETFVAIVDSGSLTAAARRSNLALSAVSRRLRDLEARLGLTLLNRTTRTIHLTREGDGFYQRCKQILSDLEDAETQASNTRGAVAGVVRIAAPLSFTMLHLSDVFSRFMETYPNVQLEVDLNDRQVDLLSEGFDVAFRIGRLADSSLIARKLFRIRHVPAAAPSLLDRLGRPAKPEDLGDLPGLTYQSRATGTEWSFTRPDGTKGGVAMTSRMACNNGDQLAAAARAGLGIACEPTFISGCHIIEGTLEPLFADHVWSSNAAYAVFPPGRIQPTRVRALVDFVAEAFGPEPWWDRRLMTEHGLV